MADKFIGIKPNILEADLKGVKNGVNMVIKIKLFMATIVVLLKNMKNGKQILIIKIYNFKINLGN